MTRPARTALTHDTSHGVPAQEMTKWFDTNYHFMVPELTQDQTFSSRIAQADQGVRRGEIAGLSDTTCAGWAGDLSQTGQECGCRHSIR